MLRLKQRLTKKYIFSYLRNEMSQAALARILNLKDDDLFFSFDADEIPKSEVTTLDIVHFDCG
jgi:hypothetical protein